MIPNFTFLGKTFSAYMFLALAGVLVMLYFGWRAAKSQGLDELHMLNLLLFSMIGVLVGSHMLYGITNLPLLLALVQGLVDECYGEFIRLVSAGRRIPVEKIRTTEIGDGRIFHGSKALQLGLIDEIGRMPEAVAKAEKLAGCEPRSLKVVRYKRNNSFLHFLFGAESNAPKALRLCIPGLSEPRLPRGCLYFLPQDYLQ